MVESLNQPMSERSRVPAANPLAPNGGEGQGEGARRVLARMHIFTPMVHGEGARRGLTRTGNECLTVLLQSHLNFPGLRLSRITASVAHDYQARLSNHP